MRWTDEAAGHPGAGFIGSHLVDPLVREGRAVLVVDDLSTGRREQVAPAVRFEQLDLSDLRLLPLVEEHAPEVVLHLAAQMDVRTRVADRLHDMRNVLGTVSRAT